MAAVSKDRHGCQGPQQPRRRRGRAPRRGARRRRASQSLEQRILLTATMCLLAFGAVMVYSASSATTLLQGSGYGSSYLIKFFVYGVVGLVVMRVLARDGVAKVHAHHGAAAVRLLRAGGRRARPARGGQRQRRAALDRAAASCSSSPPSCMKLALVLYSRDAAGQAPAAACTTCASWRKPLLIVVGGAAACSVFTQPDLGTAMVIVFTISAMLVAAGIPMRKLARDRRRRCSALVLLYALVRPYARARLTSFLDPVGARLLAAASRRSRVRSRSARAGCSASARASRCRRSSTCPRRRPTSSSP